MNMALLDEGLCSQFLTLRFDNDFEMYTRLLAQFVFVIGNFCSNNSSLALQNLKETLLDYYLHPDETLNIISVSEKLTLPMASW